MGVLEIKELEEFWDAVRVDRVQVVPVEESEGPEAVIDRALKHVQHNLPKILNEKHTGKNLNNTEHLASVLSTFAREFCLALLQEQQRQDVSVLVQLFLEVPGLPIQDAKDFLRSLPRTLLNRLLVRLESTNGARRTGLQALLSIEAMWRDRSLHQDYEVCREGDGKLVVTFYPIEHSGPLSFRLRELFVGTGP